MSHHTQLCIATLFYVPKWPKMLCNVIQIQWITFITLLQKTLLQLVQHLANFISYFNRNFFVSYAKLTTPCKNCIKLKEFGPGGRPSRPLRSVTANDIICLLKYQCFQCTLYSFYFFFSFEEESANNNYKKGVFNPEILDPPLQRITHCLLIPAP